MDIAGGAKVGGKIGKWVGLALGICAGLIATGVFFGLAGIALPGVVVYMFHSTAMLSLSQAIGYSAAAMAASSAMGTIGGWVGGELLGGLAGIFKPKQLNSPPFPSPSPKAIDPNARNRDYEQGIPLDERDQTPTRSHVPTRSASTSRGR